ncbi:SNF2-related protein [Caballeronia calidae]|uniref:SNF2-related protein n=1 Tax=Caballeronia calidae TaxID=1777139 RepID=A0A158BPJ4_9BURK|nr:DEAD/DEAH box helicase [Caballeronia calidae]SAK72004.1 SNF2-related protein [Caballeronia calidae]
MNNRQNRAPDRTSFSKDQVARWMGPKTFDKAHDYVHAVRDIGWTGDVLRARVAGTQPEPYSVDISFRADEPQGYCSCPVGYACKHVAATLLAYLEHEEQADRTGVSLEVSQWLSRFRARVEATRQAQAKAARPAAGVSHRILYVLSPSVYETLSFEVTMLKARLGVDGAIRATEVWYPNYAAWSNPPKFVDKDDEAIVRTLRTERGFSGDRFALRGKKGAAVWQMMLATGRLYFETNPRAVELVQPLREGAPRRGNIEWIPHDDDMLFASLETEPEANAVLPTEPPCYIDLSTNETGTIDAPIPDDLLADYLAMPVLTLEEADAVRAALGEFAPGLPAPPANGDTGVRTLDAAPVPVLTLDTLQIDTPRKLNAPAMELDIALLDFDYGDITIAATSPQGLVRLADGQLARIARRGDLEDACFGRLLEAGLKSVSSAPVSRDESPYAGGFIMPGRDAWPAFIAAQVPALREAGWRVVIAPNSRFDVVEIDEIDAAAHAEGNGWFDLELGIAVEQERVRLEPLLAELFARDRRWLNGAIDTIDDAHAVEFRTREGRRFILRAGRIKPLVRALIDLFDRTVWEPDTPLRLTTLEAGRLTASDEKLRWQFHGDASVIELAQRLRNAAAPLKIVPPRGLKAMLRDYQREGVDWMQFLREHDLAGVLADDMGLGKTVQTLAHILVEKAAGRLTNPALIVVPTTLVNNWQEEARRFAPELKVLDLHGPLRRERFAHIAEHDLIVTTYPLVWRDHEALARHEYHLVILDEAQHVKNASSKAAGAIRALRGRHRLCLTGTPLENHLGELWSQFDFLLPGFLGTQKEFASRWRKPIEKQNDRARRDLLARRIRPFMLRRRKDDVATELPPKTTIVRSVELADAQRDLYETVRAAMQKKVRDAIATQGFARSHILVLDALLKLRQVCCDPSLVKLTDARKTEGSAKLALLLDMLPNLIEEGRRVLVFSQFTGMLAIIAAALDDAGLGYVTLTGDTVDRKTPVKRFQAGEAPIFLISLKAGGVGLNLTAADTVIHYDPWWNPAAENQATDRAHRIGQEKPVFVYKLIATGSIEEKILEMQERKAALAAGILSADARAVEKFSAEDLDALFAPLPLN